LSGYVALPIFEHCGEFALLRNRHLGPLAVTALAIDDRQEGRLVLNAGDVTLAPFLAGHRLVRDGWAAGRELPSRRAACRLAKQCSDLLTSGRQDDGLVGRPTP
jgi:hypothetical protein